MNPIYLDYAATTPVDERVIAKMQDCADVFGNPASHHAYGKAAKALIDLAREQVAALIGANAQEIIFTSGATESNNMAIKGTALLYQQMGKHIITMKTEHKSVLDPCQYLEKQGFQVTYLTPQPNGLLNLDHLKNAIRPDTILISIMHVNNETGVVQDIDAIAHLAVEQKVLLHVDAAQSVGKLAIDLSKTPIHLLSLCAHKVYGPKGIGALYLRKKPRVRVHPLMHGGGHERGLRSGTLATHQIVGMGEALACASQCMAEDVAKITQMRELFLRGIAAHPQIHVNGDIACQVPHIVNVRFDGMIADEILARLPKLACSTASACQGKGTEGSYVLRAMGLTEAEIKSAIRFSFGRYTTITQVQQVLDEIDHLLKTD